MRLFIPTILLLIQFGFSQKILIPMDQAQKDHLKAYGTAYWILNENINDHRDRSNPHIPHG